MSNDMSEALLVQVDPNDAGLTFHILKKYNVANHILHLHDGAESLDYIFATGEFESQDISNGPARDSA